jgi:hypothetical protein
MSGVTYEPGDYPNELAGPEIGDITFPFGHNTNAGLSSTAEAKRVAIFNELEGTSVACFALEQSWMRLGAMLAEFKAQEYWRELQYQSLDAFMDELRVKFKRGRTQLWSYLSCAEHLLPSISASTLEQIGVSKALELKRAMKKLDGKALPQELIDAALQKDKTTKELRGDIGKALNLIEEQGGTWFDLDGFFMDASERKEFKEAVKATEGLLGLKRETQEHIRRKEVILAWMREWWGTHAAEFNGPCGSTTEAVLIAPGSYSVV